MEQDNKDQSLRDAVRDAMQDAMRDRNQMMQQMLQTMQAMMARMEVQNRAQPMRVEERDGGRERGFENLEAPPIRREQQRHDVGLPRYVDQPSYFENRPSDMGTMKEELLETFDAARRAADAAAEEEGDGASPEADRCVDALRRLRKIPVTTEVLVATQVGKRLRHLTKHPQSKIQAGASDLLQFWKKVVIGETANGKRNGNPESKSSVKVEIKPEKAETVKVDKISKAGSVKADKISDSESLKAEKKDPDRLIKAETLKSKKIKIDAGNNGSSGENVKVERISKEQNRDSVMKKPSSIPVGPPKLTSMIKCNDSVRDKLRELLAEAFFKVSGETSADNREEVRNILDEVDAGDPIRVAVTVESVMFEKLGRSNGAITAAGGIPPLVQILETGSSKAKEDSATILGNLCNHSEDIRACVESAEALPSLLWLLKNGSKDGKEIAAKTLNHLIRKSDTGTISQLSALLTSDQPESKIYVLDALRSLLSVAPLNDILHEGSAANDALETMIMILSSTKEETQAKSASALAGLFHCRRDLRESYIAVKALCTVMKLLNVDSEKILVDVSRCLAAIFLSIKHNKGVAAVARDALVPLVLLARSSILDVAEQATHALSNLLLDDEVSLHALPEDIIFPVTRVLRDGSVDGKTHATAAFARLLHCRSIDHVVSDYVNRAGTVLALVALLESSSIEDAVTSEVLDALVLLLRSKEEAGLIKPPWVILAEYPHTIIPLVSCIAEGTSLLQDKAIEILSRLCHDQPIILGSVISDTSGCILSIARRVIGSDCAKIKVGGAALLICAAKEHCQIMVEALNESNLWTELLHSLVGMLNSTISSSDHKNNECGLEISIFRHSKERYNDGETGCSTAVIVSNIIGIWLLSVLACHDNKSKVAIIEAGAVEILTDKISQYSFLATQNESTEDSNIWACVLLLAVLFDERDAIQSNAIMHSLPLLANLLRSEDLANRYFAAQALANLVCSGNGEILLAVSSSGAAGGLISLLGCAEADISNLLELSDEFHLVRNPEQVVLEKLFKVEDIRVGATARKVIPSLVDILKPTPDRPGAPFLALGLLTQLAVDCPSNKLVMVEAGALEALTKYLSLGPQDATEEATTDLLGILFSSADIQRHESAFDALNQLVAVLRLGGRNSRCSAAKALENLFMSDHIRNAESAWQAIRPLVEILNTGFERERYPQGAFMKLKPKKLGPCQVLEKFGDNAYRVELPDDVFISDVFNIRHLTPYAGENSSLRSSFSEEGESDEDIKSDQSLGQSNQALNVPVPATQGQPATSEKSPPGSLRRSKRLQSKRA